MQRLLPLSVLEFGQMLHTAQQVAEQQNVDRYLGEEMIVKVTKINVFSSFLSFTLPFLSPSPFPISIEALKPVDGVRRS